MALVDTQTAAPTASTEPITESATPTAEITATPVKSENKTFVDVNEPDVPKPHWSKQTPPKPATPAAQTNKPVGWDQVDLNELPKPVQERFHRLYGQVKEGERQWKVAQEYIQNMESRLAEFEKKSAERDAIFEDKELDDLQNRAQAAFDNGDHVEGNKLLRELAKKEGERAYKFQQEQAELLRKQQEQEQQNATNTDTIPQEAAEFIVDWAKNVDFMQPSHELFAPATEFIAKMLKEPQYSNLSYEEILEITKRTFDNYMVKNGKKQATNQPQPSAAPPTNKFVNQVLGSNTSVLQTNQNTIQLSDQEKNVAIKLFPNISREDAYKKYARGKK